MNRPLHAWIAFAAGLLAILAAMGWMTRAVLRLERSEVEAARAAEVEENVRLALWRMDSALAPLLLRESIGFSPPIPPGSGDEPPNILLRCHVDPEGAVTARGLGKGGYSKEVAARVDRFRAKVDPEDLRAALRALPEGPPGSPPPVQVPGPPGSFPELARQQALEPIPQGDQQQNPAFVQGPVQQPAQQAGQQQMEQQQAKIPLQQRSQIRQTILNRSEYLARNDNFGNNALALTAQEGIGPAFLRPAWVGDELVLLRAIPDPAGASIDGVWIDWPRLSAWLLASAADLLPGSRLDRVRPGESGRESRRLAALPAALVPGPPPPVELPGLTPLRTSLLIAWTSTLLVAAAAGGLLRGLLGLSERRAAFVSAVTHELRTPLTTFRMYTEMLAADMVPEEKRRPYLETISREAGRLSHLVANVLSYAKLERGRPAGRLEAAPAGDLAGRAAPALRDRAEQAGMELVLEVLEDAGAVRVRADPAAVDQVLFNLVDNAAKYASRAADRRIHLEVRRGPPGRLAFRVRDHGPGIAEPERLFRPFSRSAREAAGSAPGVGLGLALSRRLARAMGGDLVLDGAEGDGASFELRLPLA